MTRAQNLASLYREYGVCLNLSGHMHVQHIRTMDSLTDIATSALTIYPCQYGILEGFTYHTRSVDVAAWAEETGQKNTNLLAFSDYAECFFELITRQSLAEELKNRSLPEDGRKRLIEESVRLNRHFIAGRLDQVPDIKNILSDWQTLTKDSFWIVYLLSLTQDECSFQNMNIWPQNSSGF